LRRALVSRAPLVLARSAECQLLGQPHQPRRVGVGVGATSLPRHGVLCAAVVLGAGQLLVIGFLQMRGNSFGAKK
jgi:hypothetical protein